MKIALIGHGAIAGYVMDQQANSGFTVNALILRPEKTATCPIAVARVAELPDDVTLVVDCAGHAALSQFGPDILRSGRSLITVSIGALADDALMQKLTDAAHSGGSTLHLTSGALGGLDALRSAAAGTLSQVRYTGRKPPTGWIGSPAEKTLDLSTLTKAQTHFTGSARQAALAYPKNANVAAAVALAGLGFDDTQVQLIADPTITANIHEVEARGDFGRFTFQITGDTLPGNPRTSALAAMSVVAKIKDLAAPIRF